MLLTWGWSNNNMRMWWASYKERGNIQRLY